MNLEDRTRLVKVLRLLDSPHEGEVIAALHRARIIAEKHGTTLADLVSGPPHEAGAGGMTGRETALAIEIIRMQGELAMLRSDALKATILANENAKLRAKLAAIDPQAAEARPPASADPHVEKLARLLDGPTLHTKTVAFLKSLWRDVKRGRALSDRQREVIDDIWTRNMGANNAV